MHSFFGFSLKSRNHSLHRHAETLGLGCLVLFACLAFVSTSALAADDHSSQGAWKLVWSDEFNSPDGSLPDPSKWMIETGGGGWGNNELESYTARPQNVQIRNGNLVINAIKEKYTGADGVARDYTSGRLKTQGKFAQQYGRFEARIKLPIGKGMWPAFWMLGANIDRDGWPTCGELDIMESVDPQSRTVWGSLHEAGPGGKVMVNKSFTLPKGQKFSDDYHIYAVEWEPNVVRFYVDSVLFQTRTPADFPAGSRWGFDHPYFVLLNLAVGGSWPGNPGWGTDFPQSMLVDYVRVYSRQ